MIISLTLIVRPSSLAASLRRTTVAFEFAQPPPSTVTVFAGKAVLQPTIAVNTIETNIKETFMLIPYFLLLYIIKL